MPLYAAGQRGRQLAVDLLLESHVLPYPIIITPVLGYAKRMLNMINPWTSQ